MEDQGVVLHVLLGFAYDLLGIHLGCYVHCPLGSRCRAGLLLSAQNEHRIILSEVENCLGNCGDGDLGVVQRQEVVQRLVNDRVRDRDSLVCNLSVIALKIYSLERVNWRGLLCLRLS